MQDAPRWIRRLLTLFCATTLALLLAEALARRVSAGALPEQRAADLIEAQAAHLPASPYLIADPEIGWVIGPKARSQHGLYQADAQGRRAVEGPSGEGLSVALFGDSFTHGDDVPQGKDIASQLLAWLTQRGVSARVSNYGTPAYGVDQALLRWLRVSAQEQPDVVVLGFQPENCLRNLNLVRHLYWPGTDLPYSKPRFVQDPNLRLIGAPVPSTSQLLAYLRNPETWPEARYERFSTPRPPFLRQSRALGMLWRTINPALDPRDPHNFSPESESGALCEALVDRFASQVQGRFVLLHLPLRQDLIDLKAGGRNPQDQLLNRLASRYALLDAREVLRGVPVTDVAARHYTAEGYLRVARLLGQSLYPDSAQGSSSEN